MKAIADTLGNFVKKVSMKDEIDDVLIEKGKKGISAIAVTTDSVALVSAKLKSSAFNEYGNDEQQLPVSDLKLLINALDMCGNETINVEKTSIDEFSVLNISGGNTRAQVPLADKEVIVSTKFDKVPSIKYPVSIELKVKKLGDAVRSLKKTIEGDISIINEEGNIKFRVKGDSGELLEKTLITGKFDEFEQVNVDGGKLENIISTLTEDMILLGLMDDTPVYIREKSDDSLVEYFIAPRIHHDSNTVETGNKENKTDDGTTK